MTLALVMALHTLSAVIWVGGMFFAYMALRPVAATLLEPPLRLPLWSQVFKRFFLWVWIAVVLLPVTGTAMLMLGGASTAQLHVQIMMGLGTLMIALYMHVYFAPYRRLNRAIEQRNWPEAGQWLAQIRKTVAVNMSLGLLVVAIASAGRFF